MTLSDIVVIGFAVFRLTSLLALEEGPWDILVKMRLAAGVRFDENNAEYSTTGLSKMILCPWCLSVWVAIAAYILYLISRDTAMTIAIPLCLSGISIILNQITTR